MEVLQTVDRVLDVMLAPPKKEATNDRVHGVQPHAADKIEIDRWEERTGRTLTSGDVDEVARSLTWCYVSDAGNRGMQSGRHELTPFRSSGMICSTTDVRSPNPCAQRLLTRAATWDTPPPTDSALYPAFKAALGRYLAARQVDIPILSPTEVEKRESVARRFQRPPLEQPSCVVGGVSGLRSPLVVPLTHPSP